MPPLFFSLIFLTILKRNLCLPFSYKLFCHFLSLQLTLKVVTQAAARNSTDEQCLKSIKLNPTYNYDIDQRHQTSLKFLFRDCKRINFHLLEEESLVTIRNHDSTGRVKKNSNHREQAQTRAAAYFSTHY
jgi:hypothetical protein